LRSKQDTLTPQPFFSLVIPTYNREHLIPTTLKSLLNQEYENFEIIVVDDGGSDNTERIAKEFGDQRIRYVKKTNGERGAARNHGASLAEGEYINFFDSDDMAYPNHLAVAKEAIARLHHPEIFHLGYDVKNANGDVEKVCDRLPLQLNATLIDGNHLSCNGVFMRRDVAASLRFNEDRQLAASEDYELWLRLASRYDFHGIQKVTSTVYNHDSRSVVQTDAAKISKRVQLLVKYLMKDDLFVSRYRNQLHVFKAYLNVYVALHIGMAKGSAREGISLLAAAFQLHPTIIFSRRFMAALKQTLI
jgi:glycosyltransferase involved in cell wall biosynthesis